MAQLTPDLLASAIEGEMPQAYQDVKNVPFPGGDPNDRKPLFLAIPRSSLKTLQANQSTLTTSMDLKAPAPAPVTNTVSNLVLNIKTS